MNKSDEIKLVEDNSPEAKIRQKLTELSQGVSGEINKVAGTTMGYCLIVFDRQGVNKCAYGSNMPNAPLEVGMRGLTKHLHQQNLRAKRNKSKKN